MPGEEVFVAGGTGDIGRPLVTALPARGSAVRTRVVEVPEIRRRGL